MQNGYCRKMIICLDQCSRGSGAGQGRQVTFLQDAAMVTFVTSRDKNQSTDGNFFLIGYAAASPGLVVE